jgi:hypothetical protein
VKPNNLENIKYLNTLNDAGIIDVWTELKHSNGSMNVLISPINFNSYIPVFEAKNIDYTIINNDIQE